jgi:hypothetical protein
VLLLCGAFAHLVSSKRIIHHFDNSSIFAESLYSQSDELNPVRPKNLQKCINHMFKQRCDLYQQYTQNEILINDLMNVESFIGFFTRMKRLYNKREKIPEVFHAFRNGMFNHISFMDHEARFHLCVRKRCQGEIHNIDKRLAKLVRLSPDRNILIAKFNELLITQNIPAPLDSQSQQIPIVKEGNHAYSYAQNNISSKYFGNSIRMETKPGYLQKTYHDKTIKFGKSATRCTYSNIKYDRLGRVVDESAEADSITTFISALDTPANPEMDMSSYLHEQKLTAQWNHMASIAEAPSEQVSSAAIMES